MEQCLTKQFSYAVAKLHHAAINVDDLEFITVPKLHRDTTGSKMEQYRNSASC